MTNFSCYILDSLPTEISSTTEVQECLIIIPLDDSHAIVVIWLHLTIVSRLVSVGGDGTFTQIINGLIQRTGHDRNLDIDDIEVNIGQLPLRIGIIPSGIPLMNSLLFKLRYIEDTRLQNG